MWMSGLGINHFGTSSRTPSMEGWERISTSGWDAFLMLSKLFNRWCRVNEFANFKRKFLLLDWNHPMNFHCIDNQKIISYLTGIYMFMYNYLWYTVLKLIIYVNYRKSRTTFDTSETRRQFGPIVIDYAKVQSKVALKYDSLDKEILAKFGALLGNEMATFHTHISKVFYFSNVTCFNSLNNQ